MKDLIQAEIAKLESYRAELEMKKEGAWEFDRPEQDNQARMYRDGWRQAFDGIDSQLALYRRQLAKEA